MWFFLADTISCCTCPSSLLISHITCVKQHSNTNMVLHVMIARYVLSDHVLIMFYTYSQHENEFFSSREQGTDLYPSTLLLFL